MEVIRPDGFERISVEGKQAADFASNALSLGTAYGLALQGLEEERVGANLLPQALVKQRVWKAKQPWFLAAACLVALAVGAGYARYWFENAAYEQSRQSVEREVDGIVGHAERLVRDLTGFTGDAGTVPFGTDGGWHQHRGISTVVCGPGDIDQAHQPDEYIAPAQLAACDAFLTALTSHLADV
jgi:hypothetical protein